MLASQKRDQLVPDVPSLNPGIQLLDADGSRAVHALTVDHALLSSGDACWIGTGTHANSTSFVELAPSNRILDRIVLARAFTPFQHLGLLESLPEMLTDRTELIVVPDIDGYYRSDDLLAEEGKDMLLSGIADLARIARKREIPVLVTRTGADKFSTPIKNAASDILHCRSTPFGPRFWVGGEDDPDDETLVYPVGGGTAVQTTLAFWQHVLAARLPLYEGISQEVTVRGAN